MSKSSLKINKTAVGYVRVAYTNGCENSVEHQVECIKEYCHDHKIDLKKIYYDIGFSGNSLDRPGFGKMTSDIVEDNGFDYVVTSDLSRIARKYAVYEDAINALEKLGIELVKAEEYRPMDLSTVLRKIFAKQVKRGGAA